MEPIIYLHLILLFINIKLKYFSYKVCIHLERNVCIEILINFFDTIQDNDGFWLIIQLFNTSHIVEQKSFF